MDSSASSADTAPALFMVAASALEYDGHFEQLSASDLPVGEEALQATLATLATNRAITVLLHATLPLYTLYTPHLSLSLSLSLSAGIEVAEHWHLTRSGSRICTGPILNMIESITAPHLRSLCIVCQSISGALTQLHAQIHRSWRQHDSRRYFCFQSSVYVTLM